MSCDGERSSIHSIEHEGSSDVDNVATICPAPSAWATTPTKQQHQQGPQQQHTPQKRGRARHLHGGGSSYPVDLGDDQQNIAAMGSCAFLPRPSATRKRRGDDAGRDEETPPSVVAAIQHSVPREQPTPSVVVARAEGRLNDPEAELPAWLPRQAGEGRVSPEQALSCCDMFSVVLKPGEQDIQLVRLTPGEDAPLVWDSGQPLPGSSAVAALLAARASEPNRRCAGGVDHELRVQQEKMAKQLMLCQAAVAALPEAVHPRHPRCCV
eukprot:m.131853 g.131853  ORF g.131853 m.131853 type:complete len:267 (+) comp16831_c1_seq2:436-1236(+)